MRRLTFGAILIVVASLAVPAVVSAQESRTSRPRAVTPSPDAGVPQPEVDDSAPQLGARTEAIVAQQAVETLAVTSAADVSTGLFGSNTGGGMYAFPGYVGFGTTTPAGRVHILNGQFFSETNSSDSVAQGFTYQKSRGSVVSKTIVASGDSTGQFNFRAWDGSGYKATAMIRSIVDGTPGADDTPGRLVFYTTPDGTANVVERLRITNQGNVGINTMNPAYKLHVVGDAFVSGTLSGGNIQAQYQDIAEWVPSTHELDGGAVVVLNRERSNEVTLSSTAYDTTVAGVVSEQPGLTLGVAGDSKEMIATTGRVRVLVDASKAPIRIGDLLVSSDRPGYAMKSMPIEIGGRHMHQPGTIIGKALENLETGEGKILVLLSLQ